MWWTLSNLYPRPDEPTRGLFNLQLFRELSAHLPLRNVCLVPEWRVWRWPSLRAWVCPEPATFDTHYRPVFYLPLVGRSLNAACYVRSLRRLVAELGQGDGLYAAWLYPDGVAAVNLARARGVSCWLMAMGSDTFHLHVPSRRRQIVDACRAAAGVVCVCRLLADRLANAGVPPDKLHVIPNGVDATRFTYRARATAREQLRMAGAWPATLAAETPLVLYVGNLVPVKGGLRLLEAWSRFRVSGAPAAHLVMIGDGPLRSALECRSRHRVLAGSVSLLGRRPHAEVAQWMNAADVLCLPSHSEGMPNVVLEAGASGLPVVAAGVGAVPEILESEPAAAIVTAETGDAWAQETAAALVSVLSRSVDRKALSQRFHDRYSWARMAAAVAGLLRTGSGNPCF